MCVNELSARLKIKSSGATGVANAKREEKLHF